jgi:hypothetical protein
VAAAWPKRREGRVAGREGTTIGPYRLSRRLGGGGAGEVYLAQGPLGAGETGEVAVKVISGNAADPTARAIAQQAQAAGELHLAHVLPVYGVVQQDATLAVAMAYAAGGSLGDTLRAPGPDGAQKLTLPLAGGVVARLLVQLAKALAAAHAARLTHGDIKPNNIFVRTSQTGQPLAAFGDFGQSVLTGAAAAIAARPAGQSPEQSAWAATQLLFAAPEQLRGEHLPASDQYALAAVVYLLLTGETLFAGDATALVTNIATQDIMPPSQINPALGPAVDAALLRALARAPGQRFPGVADFAQALDDALAAPAGAPGRSGITQQFAELGGAQASAGHVASGSVVAQSGGARLTAVAGARPRGPSARPPADTPRNASRPLAIVAGVAALIGLLACTFAFTAFGGASILPRIRLAAQPIFSGSGSTPTPNPTTVVQARSAEQQLRGATAGHPVIAYTLTTSTSGWPTDGKATFFAPDGLHVRNLSAANVFSTDIASSTANRQDFVARIDMQLAAGKPGQFAGLRFLVNPDGAGGQNYYCYLISIEGRFEVWLHWQGRWQYVTDGYASAIKTGLHQTNTLTVLAHGALGQALLFINGQFVEAVQLNPNGPTSGVQGVMALDSGTEAVFTNFALYAIGAS